MAMGGTLFEELGFYYVGPIDGHNMDHLLPVLKMSATRHRSPVPGPRRDQEGQGLRAGRGGDDKYHGVVKFDVVTGAQAKAAAGGRAPPTPRSSPKLIAEAERRQIVADHGGDAVGHRGRQISASAFPTRTFDVGIAEQHAVTFAAGLAAEG
jgi:1-deoxy-D-xylulose-5-phosphate synthase